MALSLSLSLSLSLVNDILVDNECTVKEVHKTCCEVSEPRPLLTSGDGWPATIFFKGGGSVVCDTF